MKNVLNILEKVKKFLGMKKRTCYICTKRIGMQDLSVICVIYGITNPYKGVIGCKQYKERKKA